MNDRELLELAAKAAGMGCKWSDDGFMYWSGLQSLGVWNPLDDDGDALRLAVDLELNVFHVAGSCYAMQPDSDGSDEQIVRYCSAGGKYTATRLAITRAAAEIGKAIP